MNSRPLPFLASVLPPSVFLLYLYQQNAASLSIWHTLIAIAVFTTGAVIMHLVFSRLVKSSGAAVLINNLLWILFFTIKAPYKLSSFLVRQNLAIYLCIMLLITTIILVLIIRYKSKLQRQLIFKTLSVFWLALFMLNAVPSLKYAIGNHSKYIADENNYKTEFNVDSNLPSPNIYWLLMDGMLGFKAMEHLFNDSQPEFTSQLTERGFIINREAQFEALHGTAFSIPVLMCPHFYDIIFKSVLQSVDTTDYKQKMKVGNITNFGKSCTLARAKNELITSFNQRKEYQTSVIAIGSIYLPPITDNYYLWGKKIIKGSPEVMNDIEIFQVGFNLLFDTTPLSKFRLYPLLNLYENSKFESTDIPETSILLFESFFGESYQGSDKWYLSALKDIMNYSGPKLVIIHDVKAHAPYKYDKKGKIIKQDLLDPYNYPTQHYFASAIVISYIDFILNADHEAIIVLQSDHGLHIKTTRQILISKYRKTDEDVRIMQNQTISAIRIPDKWGGLEQPVEPPNITRLLVNRYVGENYTMLASGDIIK